MSPDRSSLLGGRRRRIAALAALASLWHLLGASSAGAQAADLGDVTIVEPADPTAELTEGGSDTDFSLRLPDDAVCPGDSFNDQWRVQSFLIPVADDPALLEWDEVGPAGEGRYPLYQLNTSPFDFQLTIPNEQPGQPGRLAPIPAFDFGVFPPGELPPGRYRVGIACTLFRDTDRFWDTEIDVVADAGDEPAGFRWTVAGASADAGSGDGSRFVWILGGAALVATVVMFALRRSQTAVTPSPLQENR